MFGDNFKKKFGGKPDMNGGGDSYEKKPPFGGEEGGDMEEKKIPGSGRPEEENPDEDKKEKTSESPDEEKGEEEAIEEILELFDQLTPLIEKLRNRK
jgi:hypothetical protein